MFHRTLFLSLMVVAVAIVMGDTSAKKDQRAVSVAEGRIGAEDAMEPSERSGYYYYCKYNYKCEVCKYVYEKVKYPYYGKHPYYHYHGKYPYYYYKRVLKCDDFCAKFDICGTKKYSKYDKCSCKIKKCCT